MPKKIVAIAALVVFATEGTLLADECLIKSGKYLQGIARYASPRKVTCVGDHGAALSISGKDDFQVDIPYARISAFAGQVARSKNVSAGEAIVFGGYAFLKAKQKTFIIKFTDEKGRPQEAQFQFSKKDMERLAQSLDGKVK